MGNLAAISEELCAYSGKAAFFGSEDHRRGNPDCQICLTSMLCWSADSVYSRVSDI